MGVTIGKYWKLNNNEKIQTIYDLAWNKAEELGLVEGVDKPTLYLVHSEGSWGKTIWQDDECVVCLSKIFLANEEGATNTIVHELAHVIAGRIHNHDKVWETIGNMIGKYFGTTMTESQPDKSVYGITDNMYAYHLRCTKCNESTHYTFATDTWKHSEFFACRCGGRIESFVMDGDQERAKKFGAKWIEKTPLGFRAK